MNRNQAHRLHLSPLLHHGLNLSVVIHYRTFHRRRHFHSRYLAMAFYLFSLFTRVLRSNHFSVQTNFPIFSAVLLTFEYVFIQTFDS